MSCNIPKQHFRDDNRNGDLSKTDEFQEIFNIERSRISKHFKNLTDAESETRYSCDGHWHFRHCGIDEKIKTSTGNMVDASFQEIIFELCPDWVAKNPKATESSSFKSQMPSLWNVLQITHVDQAAFATARGFYKSSNQILIIGGECGRGKTTIAKAIANDFTRENERAEFITCEHLVETFLQAQPSSGEVDHEARQKLIDMRKADLCIIDDLGTASREYSEFFKEKFKMFLDDREGRLIVTSNLSREEIEQKFNDKIVGRLFDHNKLIVLRGKDYRRGS